MTTFETADGVTLAVDADAGDGPVMLFQHGLCGNAGQAREAFPAETRFRRVTVEMCGHGRSQAGDPGRFSIAQFTDDLIAFIETRLDAPVVIGGISMGAALCLRLAVLRPDLVRGLILVRPAWAFAAAPENLIPNIEVGRALQSEIPEETRRQFLAGKTAAQLREAAPDNLASLTGFFERQPTVVTAALLTTISVDGTGVSANQASALGVPCRVIAQARDKVHPLALAQELAASIPGADFVEITPKAVYKAAYARDLRAAIASFLEILR